VSVREVDAAWRRREKRERAEERERELRLALSSNLGGCTASAIWIPSESLVVGGRSRGRSGTGDA
jgi:hypothetical protein